MPERLGAALPAPLFESVALIGMGLIGSSIARAVKKKNLAGRIVAIDNWRRLLRFGVPGPFFNFPRRMDKGWEGEMRAWIDGVATGVPPIPHDELFEVSRWAIRAAAQARS